ncbi:MAG: dihydrolipoyl dehydrogenase [Gammaproteobacteria bacterium]|jgi:dihydrolipoamide dehydrogenase|nr:dihydrolipoyl dehydrogenase [Gammaproteobacteria bacterium]MDH3848044.1 dihydrolipoyl dehydrogenase [Gammaproteobacteria bacterium]MDH3904324.1 dihydrolipoyl dehydrogenase [Gammaproteobacteria bacterium]MDH3954448.1 dihydrolipoyl dehydrogenase [Gammaproteobacteria bacterium]
MSRKFDVVVIGAGPGGYVAAIRAAQHGMSVACIDEWKNRDGKHAFGGTCLNAGCIPSKAMLESSELYHRAGHEFKKHGIKTGELGLDIAAMQKRRAGIVRQLTGGIAGLFKANKVEGLVGHGKLLAGRKVEFTPDDGDSEILEAKSVILASGSAPIELPFARFDGETIIDSWDALELEAIPERLGVIGAGVIGLELGSVWSRLGSKVTILEAMDDFLFMADRDVANVAARDFKKQGLDIQLGAKVTAAKAGKKGVKVEYDDKAGSHAIEVDKLIVAVGRKPYTEGLLADDAGIQLDDRGFIVVDEDCRTRVKGVFAVGDSVRGPMLAHKSSEEGVMAADLIAGEIAEVNYNVIPSVIYTAPEIAWVGKTEAEVKESGRPYKKGSFPFAANGRAKAMEQTTGMVKIISAEDDDEVLGVHIVGPMAGELISEAVLALEFSASTEDIQRTIHAHPSLAESIHEAALAVDKRALNYMN